MSKHPAKFTDTILERIGDLLEGCGWPQRILDPFAGTGRVHLLPHEAATRTHSAVTDDEFPLTVGVELEPEWATMHPQTIVGNALRLPFADATFDGMVTSPCLAQGHRVLKNDLTWAAAGDIEVGETLVAFDEHPQNAAWRGTASRRRWKRTEVVRSEPKTVDCVRVILANGDELITTPEHPWLAYRRIYRDGRPLWTASKDLLDQPWVMRQMTPWQTRTGYDAGWLAGMLDGEGSLSLGSHGCPKLCCYQVEGPVADRVEELMHDFGYEPNRIIRKGIPAHRQKVANLYVTGGFPTLLQALGELRPRRLLAKWEQLDITTRTVQADKVQVLAVEPAGKRDIQEIETTAGTYYGEGYLMHNCYGNRFADSHNAKDGSRRRSYTHDLGRKLHDDNAGTLQWGDKYRAFHEAAWLECLRVLQPDALIVLNISNHIRGGQEQLVAEWHMNWFMDHGCFVEEIEAVATPRLRDGANAAARPKAEYVFALRYVAPVLTPEELLDDDDELGLTPDRTGVADLLDPAEGGERP